MKRDLDLMRDILLAVEEWNDPQPLNLNALRYEGKTQREIEYQAVLLKEAGYILATGVVSNLDPKFTLAIYRMTTAGYDYLDSVRSPEVWRKTKTALGKVGGTAALDVVKDVASKILAEVLKAHTGL